MYYPAERIVCVSRALRANWIGGKLSENSLKAYSLKQTLTSQQDHVIPRTLLIVGTHTLGLNLLNAFVVSIVLCSICV